MVPTGTTPVGQFGCEGGVGTQEKAVRSRSLAPSHLRLPHYVAEPTNLTARRTFYFFLHKMSQCSTCSLLPPSSTLSSLPDVSPQFFRRSRYGSRLFSGRDNPWIPLWLSEGSRCEFGWLACIVSTILTSGNTHYARNCHWLV